MNMKFHGASRRTKACSLGRQKFEGDTFRDNAHDMMYNVTKFTNNPIENEVQISPSPHLTSYPQTLVAFPNGSPNGDLLND